MILFNLEVKNYALLPEPSGDIDDKLLVLRSSKATFPTSNEEIARRTKEALPAFLYRLRHKYKAPASIRNSGRYKIQPYKNPEIQRATAETSHAGQIKSLLQRFLISMAIPKLKIKGSDLYFTILEDSKHRVSLEKICKSATRFVQLMGALTKIEQSGVTRGPSHKDRAFTLERLEIPETPEGTIPFGDLGSEIPKTQKKGRPQNARKPTRPPGTMSIPTPTPLRIGPQSQFPGNRPFPSASRTGAEGAPRFLRPAPSADPLLWPIRGRLRSPGADLSLFSW
jgi:hypothetical protein